MADRVLGVLGVGLVEPTVPVLRADDLGVVRGDGCFETVRVADARAGALDSFDAHLERLARSAARLDLPAPPAAAWRGLVAELLAAWDQPGEALLRIVLTRGIEGADTPMPTGFATIGPIPAEILRQRRDGVRVLTLSRGQPAEISAAAPWLLGGVKTTSYAVHMAALRYAQRHDADDVIFVSTDGQVLEGPTATVVWLAGGALHSPPAEPLGILAGTTARRLFAHANELGFATATSRATPADLAAADGVWLVSSVRLAAAVISLDGASTQTDRALTARIQTALGG